IRRNVLHAESAHWNQRNKNNTEPLVFDYRPTRLAPIFRAVESCPDSIHRRVVPSRNCSCGCDALTAETRVRDIIAAHHRTKHSELVANSVRKYSTTAVLALV